MTRRSAAALAGLLLALMLAGGAAPSLAVTFTVNSTGDGADTNTGDGICDSDSGAPGEQCTLRAVRMD